MQMLALSSYFPVSIDRNVRPDRKTAVRFERLFSFGELSTSIHIIIVENIKVFQALNNKINTIWSLVKKKIDYVNANSIISTIELYCVCAYLR